MPALPLESLPEIVRQHVDPAGAKGKRVMAARGFAPFSPEQMLLAYHQLAFDPNEKIQALAKTSLTTLPDKMLIPPIAKLPAEVLDAFSYTFNKKEHILEAIILAKAVADETIKRIAKGCSESICELISGNEVRILRFPAIIEALYLNPAARNSTTTRLIDLARRNKVTFSEVPALKMLLEDKRVIAEMEKKTSEVSDDQFSKILQEGAAEDSAEQAAEAALTPQERKRKEQEERRNRGKKKKEKEKKKGSRTAEIDRMSISERVRLATLGSRGDRNYLIRQPNRLIHMAAVTGPKVTIKDIISWAGNKSMPEGVIRYIANRRQFRRNYQILLSLVNNVKTPLPEAISILNHLHINDLIKLSRNRTIPHQLQRAAKRLKEQREKRRG